VLGSGLNMRGAFRFWELGREWTFWDGISWTDQDLDVELTKIRISRTCLLVDSVIVYKYMYCLIDTGTGVASGLSLTWRSFGHVDRARGIPSRENAWFASHKILPRHAHLPMRRGSTFPDFNETLTCCHATFDC
jgi:hypothetical protein